MMLRPGDLVGPYVIGSSVGAGGMGEVYRARDNRLGREVAVKVVQSGLAADPELLRRFESEARAVAQLNHRNVLTVYDVGEHDGRPYLVTELLEGQTLRERLKSGALPVSKAIDYAGQIARGLAAAHARGIVHRDLKPENVFLTTDGAIKILDFGLAKLEPPPVAPEDATSAPTEASPTRPGTVLGTAGYMSPEQIRGLPADARSDLFALGAVLYEMLAGRRAFDRPSGIEAMSAILNEDPPPLATLPGGYEGLDAVARRCLAKAPDDRFQSARDLAFVLDSIAPGPLPVGPRPRGRRGVVIALGLALVAVIALAAFAVARWRRSEPGRSGPPSMAQWTLTPLTTDPGYEGEPSFSPDGQTIAYVSDRTGDFEIYMQQVSGGEAINLTKNSSQDVQPAFSPDGKWIAFVSTRSSTTDLIIRGLGLPLMGGDVWVMPALGGLPKRVAEGGNFPSFSPDGSEIVLVRGPWFGSEICRVPAGGGTPRAIDIRFGAGDRAGSFFTYPSYSADGRWLLFGNAGGVFIVSASGGEARKIARGESPSWSAWSSSVLYSNGESGKNFNLWRIPFSLKDGMVAGDAEPLTFGRGPDEQASASRDGATIAFAALERSMNLEALSFDAEEGKATGPPYVITHGNNDIGFFSPSPRGETVVYQANRGAETHLWRVDPPGLPTQLTADAAYLDSNPRWAPDGAAIAFNRAPVAQPQKVGVWLMTSDGADPHLVADDGVRPIWMPAGGEILFPRDGRLIGVDTRTKVIREFGLDTKVMNFLDVSRDGRWLVTNTIESGDVDVRAIPLGGGPSKVVVSTPRNDFHPFLSPSGRWLYFQPDHKNVYRVPGPAENFRPSPPEKVTNFPEGGLYLEEPQIAADGHTLFYGRGRCVGDIWIMRFGSSGAVQPTRAR